MLKVYKGSQNINCHLVFSAGALASEKASEGGKNDWQKKWGSLGEVWLAGEAVVSRSRGDHLPFPKKYDGKQPTTDVLRPGGYYVSSNGQGSPL